MKLPINVFSEIGKLREIVVHRPGKELENLTPNILKLLLFDDIPFLKIAQKEHDYFVKMMCDYGVNVIYFENLAIETLNYLGIDLRIKFIQQFIKEANVNKKNYYTLEKYLLKLNNRNLIEIMIRGITSKDLAISDENMFICYPLVNILFQRDLFITIGNGVAINKMWSKMRNREVIFAELIFKYHPKYKDIPLYYERGAKNSLEGGDLLVLNDKNLIIGNSQRTSYEAIEVLSKNIFADSNNTYERIIILEIPKVRSFMHLDTVFTNIDYDKFLIHPLIFDYITEFKIYEITNKGVRKIDQTLQKYLSNIIGRKAQFIACGGGDSIAAAREQWNDATNVLTLQPGVVIAYDRNNITIDFLRRNGIKVLEIPSSELSRGRGGPRCMSMPLIRDKI